MPRIARRLLARLVVSGGLAVALGTAGLLAPAFAPSSASAAEDGGADRVVVGALRFTSSAPIFIAYERGYFADEGLDVAFSFFQGAQPVAVAIASGDVDFGLTALTGGFFNLARNGALKVIGGHFHEVPDHEGSAVLASNQAYDAGLTSPEALAGHSLAITQVGSSFHYMAGRIAEAAGFPLSEISLKPMQKVGAMIGALKSGQVDSMIIVPHIAHALDKAGAAKIIGWVNAYAPYQVTTLFTSTRNVAERPALVERFVRAYQRGIADYRAVMLDQEADPAATDEMTRLIHQYVYTDRPYDKAAPSIQAGAIYVNENARLDVGDVAAQVRWFQDQGLLATDFDHTDIVDTRFVEAYNVPD
ncbi:ABC transporter substrate-binding protein [Roseospira goensis]|uniref:NitT/TauT family transport system substrate-binding protein n=1 Tax=Roseospira goensis TaxID=391922 RepID=A0A7W6RYN4_9PROT|nr:ABC transporter substrate-binding protein [Roseospira goensis]MBB4285009.1 NitT/TauT family transport system substrate-binding protein [Roseospira goensis]